MTGFLRSFPALSCAIAFAVLPGSADSNASASSTKVCLTATPKSGYTFSHWGGATLDSGNCVIVKNTLAVAAAFSKIP